MAFARKVWHLLVGIKDGLVLLFMLLFFMLLYGVLTARSSAGLVRDGALLLRLDGAIVEEPRAQDPLEMLLSDTVPAQEYRARDLARAVRLAASDDRIKAVVLDLSRFTGGGMVSLTELGEAMDEVRKAGKPVLTYAVGYVDDGLLLAAHASEVWVDPFGGAFVMGPGGNRLYYGALLERLKVNAHVYKVGTYKDYVEPFLYNQASAPSKEARRALYAALWDGWKANVAKARPKAQIDKVAADPVGWLKASGGDAAKASLAAGLVDKVGDKVAFGERVKAIAGEDHSSGLPGRYAHTKPAALLAAHPEKTPGEAVAVVTVAGEIVDGKAGPGTAGGERIAKLIDEASDDEAKALVLRVDSPGGSVLASEHIRLAVERFKAKGNRPVAVSMANLAASGGYWVATPAQRIFAEPATITGSIGIFAVIPSFERTLADWGVSGDGVRTTPLSGQPDLFTGFTPELEAMMQANIEHGYARFTTLVGKSRGKSPEEVARFAEGRAWDGGTARQLGLVDQFGGLEEALAWAAGAAKLEKWHADYYGKDADPYASLLERLGGGDEEEQVPAAGRDLLGLVAQRQQDQLARALGDLSWLTGVRGAQAYCLDCPVAASAAPRVDRGSWLTKLAAVFVAR
jgi:protease IV